MALPNLATAGAGMLGSVLESVAGLITKPFQSTLGQFANYNFPISLPDISAIIGAQQRGLITDLTAYQAAARKGIMFDPGSASEARFPHPHFERRLWDAAADLQWIRPYPQFMIDAYARGILGRDAAKRLVTRAGGHWNDWAELLGAHYAWPPAGMVLEARNRGYIGRDAMHQYLGHLGIGDADARALVDKMREAIPSISDLIHMQIREAFAWPLAQQLQLYDEFPADIVPWMEKLGYYGGPDQQVQSDGVARRATWPLMYWASHWQPISPTQNYEMMYRLRPGLMALYANRLQALTGQAPNLIPWSMDQVRRWLRVQDYPPAIRDNLAAISFRLPRLWELKSALRLGILQRLQVIQQLLDRGHPSDDAEWIADVWIAQEQRQREAPAEALRKSLVRRNYNALLCLYDTGFASRDVVKGNLQVAGLSEATAELALSVTDLEALCKQTRELLTRFRRDFLVGVLTAQAAKDAMLAAGIQPDRADGHLAFWRTLLTTRRRQLSTEKVLRLLRGGFIGSPEAEQRLANLGWAVADRSVLVTEATARMVRDQALFEFRELQGRVREVRRVAREVEGRLRRQDRERIAAARRLEATQQRAENLGRRTQADLRRIIPISRLIRWYARDYIDEGFLVERLAAQGYSPEAVEGYRRDANEERAKYRESIEANGEA